MKLRIILLVLSLLVFLSASTGGYLYYSSLKEAAFREANRQSSANLDMIKKNLSAYLSENIKPVKALSGMEGLLEMLVRPGHETQRRANTILDLYKEALEVDVDNLDEVLSEVEAAGHKVVWPRTEVRPGVSIGMVEDPYGNWVEFIQAA